MEFFKLIKTETFWREFFDFSAEKVMPDHKVLNRVRKIIEKKLYENYTEEFFKEWPIPKYVKIPRYNTKKTRNVFIYDTDYNIILKAMAYYLLLKYNDNFANNSLAYTWGRGPKTAFARLKSFKLTKKDIIYKNDFTDYFNQIDLNILEPKLKEFFKDDLGLVEFIMTLLRDENVLYKNKPLKMETKGVMAGTPISGILANVYMHELDIKMAKRKYKYLRYADDTLIVGTEALEYFKEELAKLNINLNPKKEEIFNIQTGITFLGFKYKGKKVDISDEAKAKMKSRMKRRARWYQKWARVNNVPIEIAIKDYIGGINEKLYTDLEDSTNWSLWYFTNINTVETVKWLDKYYINCIRYLDSGTWVHNKKYYRLSYQDIKELGFVSLVNTYYRVKKGKPIKYNPSYKYRRHKRAIRYPK